MPSALQRTVLLCNLFCMAAQSRGPNFTFSSKCLFYCSLLVGLGKGVSYFEVLRSHSAFQRNGVVPSGATSVSRFVKVFRRAIEKSPF